MTLHAARLARVFTPEYARRINAQIVHPNAARVVKPNELESALARPLQVSVYEPYRDAQYLAATLSYGIIKGHPFMDGNKRTAFFLANEYLRFMGLPGILDKDRIGNTTDAATVQADRYVSVAAGIGELSDLVSATKHSTDNTE